MKVAYAHMGHSHLAFKDLVERLGHEAVDPEPPSQRTLSLGVRHAPEFACIPFKVVLGTYLEVLERGAEMLITSGGVGPCRAGLYGLLHQKILESLGYRFQMVVFDPPLRGFRDFLGQLRRVIKPVRVSWPRLIREIRTSWEKLKALDRLEEFSHRVRPIEVRRGDTTRALEKGYALMEQAKTREEIEEADRQAQKLMAGVEKEKNLRPLRVGIIGEIYVLLEPFINHDVEKTLEEMRVETHRSIYLTGYTQGNVLSNGEMSIREVARPYLDQLIGGHGVQSVGETILYAQKGFDGVIQLAPFTCIPEIVAKSLLPKLSRDMNIPVLSITLDEQTGKSGFQTRLEAFVDLLEHRRWKKEGAGSGSVSWY